MTAAEILDVPNEKKCWRSIFQVRAYVVAKQDEEGMTWHLYLHPGLNGNRQGSQHREWFNVALSKRTTHLVLLRVWVRNMSTKDSRRFAGQSH
ncbi:uncharacterized protein LACBIDRAFT_316712 [Laccaria bicolor S238N-H82]|uniref:Predicted protein n=2 Tax=Laccaria bicolor (strain S238N-H82 / ATCC MYA-4686) TaxID=486041 RepID=B0E1H2_LACBS|nr:uncharacterized protein LACBIDRAFT_316712 [Laccaria bicolor S238N-H82]EDQ99309.1 predicted protein [Laccaria bicolor S238N-H82]|eukprot:XP_001890029.1 predicted protein [Laccaria bicolor S238N-H82]